MARPIKYIYSLEWIDHKLLETIPNIVKTQENTMKQIAGNRFQKSQK